MTPRRPGTANTVSDFPLPRESENNTPAKPSLQRLGEDAKLAFVARSRELKRSLTPAVVLSLADAGRKRRRVDVSAAVLVRGRRGLADHELLLRNAVRDDLEERRLGPSRGRRGEQAGTSRVFRCAL